MPKVTHPTPDDDDNVFGSAEDYDDPDFIPNIYTKATRTPSDVHHYSFANGAGGGGGGGGAGGGGGTGAGTNNNGRYNVPLFGNHAGSIGASGNSVNGLNGKNTIVGRTDVRDIDNEVTSASTSVIPWLQPTNGMPILSIIPAIYFNHLSLFALNVLILFLGHLSVT